VKDALSAVSIPSDGSHLSVTTDRCTVAPSSCLVHNCLV
jgi:hypothetical protein